jgi:hypothetical protein
MWAHKRGRLVLIALLFVVILACRPADERPPLVFSPLELPDAYLGQQYEVTIAVSGNETPVFSISVDDAELPPGLTLQYEELDTTARIEGIPEKAGEFEFAVSAACLGTSVMGQARIQHYTLLVKQE